MADNTKKKNDRIVFLAINIIVILLIVVSLSFYSFYVLNRKEQDNQYNFMLSVESIKKITQNYLLSEQGYVDNWAHYINDSDMNLDDALNFLKTINTNKARIAHILDIDTFEAYSSFYENSKKIDTYLDYYDFSSVSAVSFRNTIKKMLLKDENDSSLIVLGKYTLKENGNYVISLGHKISLKTEDGYKDYLLLRTIPTDDVLNTWVLPAEYVNGETGIISSDGDYVVKTSLMKGEGFLNFISDYNFENEDEKQEFALHLKNVTNDALYYKNSLNEDCLWYYSAFDDNPDLYIIGGIRIADLESDGQIWYVTSFAIVLLILLLVIDSVYLNKTNKKLELAYLSANKASKAKTEFLSVMSHDIRTPMNVVMGMNDLAYKNADNPDMVKNCLNKAMSASKQLMTLINDILDISRIEMGKLVFNMAPVCLKQFGTELNNLMLPYADEKGIKLSYDPIDIDDVYVLCDSTRINQIYINLLSNAIKYTPSGGSVYFSLEARKKNDKCELVFVTKDTGIGMSYEFQKNMYNSFTRVLDSRNSKVSGSGLGLTIVKQVVDCMKGTIDCISELDKGTTFIVKLDLPYAEGKECICDNGDDEKILNGMRLLIVEDNELNYEIVDSILTKWKTVNTHANNGEECVTIFKENQDKFDAILMDIHMPVMDGYEATKQIRTMEKGFESGVRIPIIAMSANAFAEDVAKCKQCGMDDHIAKPIDVNKLKNALIKAKKNI